jgi:alkyl sulfatase BDS1-like metallo-beta-lactamase superfamily hydrolase
MTDLLELSSRIIDSGVVDQPVNRVTNELSELADGLAIVESFSHSVAVDTAEGLLCFDASGVHTGNAVVGAIKRWRPSRVSHLVYTHGHADHVGGSMFFAADKPAVIAHHRVLDRLQRYELTSNWNLIINSRQFGGIGGQMSLSIGDVQGGQQVDVSTAQRFLPQATLWPSETFTDRHSADIGDHRVELRHARGETDDHLWAWFPAQRWIMAGDFVIWNFPNAGNPQKVQRYPVEWAAALRDMIAAGPELLVPAHGLPITGRERIARVLDDIASALESLVAQVLQLMNTGATLDVIIHTVSLPGDTLAKPYLRPLYDEPEFVVRNIWRQFGGWWDGAASRLKPSPDAELSAALAELAGGAAALMERAESAAAAGDLRLACHLADFAGWAAPNDAVIHAGRSEIYLARRHAETSLMSKGIFMAAAKESQAIAAPQ